MKKFEKVFVLFCTLMILIGYIAWRIELLPSRPTDPIHNVSLFIGFPSMLNHMLPVSDQQKETSDEVFRSVQLCPSQNKVPSLHSDINSRFLVIGAISYPGYMVTKVLKDIGYANVRATEDISSLGFDTGTWKHWDNLREINVKPSIVDYSVSKNLNNQLDWVRNKGSTIVYIPSLLFNAIHTNSIFDVTWITVILKNFVQILESVQQRKNNVRILIITPTYENFVSCKHAAIIRLFTLLLSSYNQRYNFQTSFISFFINDSTVAHSLVHCNIDKFVEKIKSSIVQETQCIELHLYCHSDHSNQNQFLNGNQTEFHDMVTSTFFTEGGSFRSSNFQYMRAFFMTAVQQNLEILLFYDHLDDDLVRKVSKYYRRIKFVKIKGRNGRSKNDARFYILYNYLLHHPDIQSIVLQDVRDGIFLGDPLKLMNIMGSNVLYVGKDRSFYLSAYDHFWMRKNKYKVCYPKELKQDRIQHHPFYNAGTLGGTRDVMLTVLTRLAQYFDKSPHDYNCNMATVSVVVHNHFQDHSYSGYPFQDYMETKIGLPRGLTVRHKDTQYV